MQIEPTKGFSFFRFSLAHVSDLSSVSFLICLLGDFVSKLTVSKLDRFICVVETIMADDLTGFRGAS